MVNHFKDHTGKFAESLISNVKGMLTLYEAAHFGLNGEDILDQALEFCSTHLKSIVGHVSSSLATQINETLNMPLRKSFNRLGAKKFMSMYQQEESHNEILLKFAKLDFNMLQKMHRKVGLQDFGNKLPFARDRVVEYYFWILSVFFEPQYSLAIRRILTKVIAMTSIIDDIYDIYGTLDDLQLFTDAIQRWEPCALEKLRPYMRICYQALSDVYAEIEDDMKILGTSYRVHYAKEEEIIEWVSSEPLIVRASSAICRLMDDMVGHGIKGSIIGPKVAAFHP
ncbi:Germacradienol synthase [Handroanthus impetiginosus]|uniref:Germacradienol synthase n=1 Tax=Handroanthus impetiginosus TaxID=429701 RepID=A0A2G9HRE5_9LAMI|nr:Germacradienol synthase [Handroanthus impetiginosus]